MPDKKFIYQDPNGIIDINTLSPSGMFYYKVQKPKELNPSTYGCKIAFYNKDHELVYHRRNTYAHELHDKDEIAWERTKMDAAKPKDRSVNKTIELVKWSKQGNVAYFLEHYHWNNTNIYDSVILHLQDRYCYRINEINNDLELIWQLKLKNNLYDENEIIKKLNALGLHQESLFKDELKSPLDILNLQKWYP